MNHKLPSISNLLIQTPEWNVSPPSPSPQQNTSHHWSDYRLPPSPMSLSPQWPQSDHSSTLSVSPLLSPLSSPCISEHPLPPIHGDDPPPSRLTFYDPMKRLSTGALDVPSHHHLISTQRSHSMSPPRKRSLSITEEPTKRKRGRPPAVSPDPSEDQLTFLTPTVWNIPVSKDQQEREKNASRKKTTEDHMHDSMTAFSSVAMDTVLHMPRKKRGRKPKTLVHGNSCFIWKDLTSTRSK